MWCFWIELRSISQQSLETCTVLAPAFRRQRRRDVKVGWLAAFIDILLIALFGLQHSLMARPWFKQWWAAAIPPAFERCTYVHMANVALFAMIAFWQPMPVGDLDDTSGACA